MLDRAALLTQLKNQAALLFVNTNDQALEAAQLWGQMIEDTAFACEANSSAGAGRKIPQWHGPLGELIPISTKSCYHVNGIDGSQIYPDRHQGTLCFLINVGTTQCCYKSESASFKGDSKPFLYIPKDGREYTVDWVNAHRQELEFKAALTDISCTFSEKQLTVFDGSLIFWHLEHAPLIAQEFIPNYVSLLTELYQKESLIAGYISSPRNRELMNLLAYFNESYAPQPRDRDHLKQLIDVDLMYQIVPKEYRTQVFISCSPLQWAYTSFLQPSFFYCNTGYEIARVEVPWWIGQQPALVDEIAAIILDQCIKGRGYPVALSEAHEQAVIKSSDRDFFYHCIVKMGTESKIKMQLSYKHLKKRLVGI